MGSTVYINKPRGEALKLYNTTGVALVQDEFVVLAGKSLVAAEAIASAAQGGLINVDGQELQAADFIENEGTFGTANLAIYWDPTTKKFSHLATVGYYLVGYTVAPLASGVVSFVAIQPVIVSSDVSTLQGIVTAITSLSGRPFRKTVTLTAAAAGTPVPIVAEAEVTGTNKVFITDFLISVGGTTAWTDSTATVINLQDTASTPVVAATVAKAQLTSQAQLGKHSTGVTLGTPIRTGVGLTAAKGLSVAADANFAAGSNISVTVVGFIAAA